MFCFCVVCVHNTWWVWFGCLSFLLLFFSKVLYTFSMHNDRLSTEIPEFTCGPSRRHKVRVHYEEEVISDDDEYLCKYWVIMILSTL